MTHSAHSTGNRGIRGQRRRLLRRWAAGAAAASIVLGIGALAVAPAQSSTLGACGVWTVDDGSRIWMPWQCAANGALQDADAEAVDKRYYPYVWGGESPGEGGFDCSGLVHWAFNHAGVGIARLTAQQYHDKYATVSYANRRPGDLIFYADSAGRVKHVEIYLGRNSEAGNVEETIAARTPGVNVYRHVTSMSDGAGGTQNVTARVGRIVN